MSSRTRNYIYGAGLAVMAIGFATFPLLMQKTHGDVNLTRSDKPLAGHQIMRGAYLNTGSKDVGPDPDWDMTTGRYKGKTSFNPSEDDVAAARRELMNKRAKMQLQTLQGGSTAAGAAAAGDSADKA